MVGEGGKIQSHHGALNYIDTMSMYSDPPYHGSNCIPPVF
jgi:hypothetical protein